MNAQTQHVDFRGAELLGAKAFDLLSLLSQHLDILADDVHGDRLDQTAQDQVGQRDPDGDSREKIGELRSPRRQCGGRDDMAVRADSVLDLGQTGEDEAVEMRHITAARRLDR